MSPGSSPLDRCGGRAIRAWWPVDGSSPRRSGPSGVSNRRPAPDAMTWPTRARRARPSRRHEPSPRAVWERSTVNWARGRAGGRETSRERRTRERPWHPPTGPRIGRAGRARALHRRRRARVVRCAPATSGGVRGRDDDLRVQRRRTYRPSVYLEHDLDIARFAAALERANAVLVVRGEQVVPRRLCAIRHRQRYEPSGPHAPRRS